jgi:hypothetical protein
LGVSVIRRKRASAQYLTPQARHVRCFRHLEGLFDPLTARRLSFEFVPVPRCAGRTACNSSCIDTEIFPTNIGRTAPGSHSSPSCGLHRCRSVGKSGNQNLHKAALQSPPQPELERLSIGTRTRAGIPASRKCSNILVLSGSREVKLFPLSDRTAGADKHEFHIGWLEGAPQDIAYPKPQG